MKNIYHYFEKIFEKITSLVTSILGNSITFVLAVALVVFWLTNKKFYALDAYDRIRDCITGVVFLTLFIIQKSFNHFIASLHLKVNELVASHDQASNVVISIEKKTEHEINELSKEYADLAAKAIIEKTKE